MSVTSPRSDAGALRAFTTERPLARAARAVSRHGLRGAAHRAHRWLLTPLWRRIYLSEEHVWVSVPEHTATVAVPPGYAMRAGTADDLAALADMGGIAPAVARRYLERGARLYVATYEGELAYSTWIHTGSVPAVAARGGELALPDGVVSFEDSLAAPAHRRSGIALAVSHEVSAAEHRAGARLIITRVAVDNVAARKWGQKMGCTEVAIVRLRRVLFRRRVTVSPIAGGEAVAQLLAERL